MNDRLATETMHFLTQCAERKQPFLVFYSTYAMLESVDQNIGRLLHDWREEVDAPGMVPNPFF